MNLKFCVHKAKLCAESAAQKSHYVYLGAATILEGQLLLRLITGGCFVLCILGTLLRNAEEAV